MKKKVTYGIQKFLVYWLIAAGFLATYLAIGIIIGFSFTASLLWSCYVLAMISELLFLHGY